MVDMHVYDGYTPVGVTPDAKQKITQNGVFVCPCVCVQYILHVSIYVCDACVLAVVYLSLCLYIFFFLKSMNVNVWLLAQHSTQYRYMYVIYGEALLFFYNVTQTYIICTNTHTSFRIQSIFRYCMCLVSAKNVYDFRQARTHTLTLTHTRCLLIHAVYRKTNLIHIIHTNKNKYVFQCLQMSFLIHTMLIYCWWRNGNCACGSVTTVVE